MLICGTHVLISVIIFVINIHIHIYKNNHKIRVALELMLDNKLKNTFVMENSKHIQRERIV